MEKGSGWIPKIKEHKSLKSADVEEIDEKAEEDEVKALLEEIKVIDQGASVKVVSVWPMAIPIHSRGNADTLDAIQEMVSRIRRTGRTVKRLHSDQAREFLSYPIKRWLRTQGIWQTYTAGDDPSARMSATTSLSGTFLSAHPGVSRPKRSTNSSMGFREG